MRIREFGVEQWMNRYETRCDWNLAETCIESLTVAQLLDLAGKGTADPSSLQAATALCARLAAHRKITR